MSISKDTELLAKLLTALAAMIAESFDDKLRAQRAGEVVEEMWRRIERAKSDE